MRGSAFPYETSTGRRWGFVHDLPGPGRRQKKRRGFRTRKAAEAALGESLQAARTGVPFDLDRATVGQYLEAWAADVEVDPKTARVRAWVCARLAPTLGPVRLADLAPEALRGAFAALAERGLAQGSRRLVYQVLRQALGELIDRGRLSPAVWVGVRVAEPERRAFRPAAEAETQAALEALRPTRWWAPAWVLATTGLRVGELVALTWGDLRGQVLTVRPETTKGRRGRRRGREVDLFPELARVLGLHRAIQAQERLLLGLGAAGPEALLFTRQTGLPWTGKGFSRGWGYIRRHVPPGNPVRVYRAHDFRHAHASQLLAAGAPLAVVSARLGHAHPGITARVYAWAIPAAQSAAVRLGAAAWAAARDQTVTTAEVLTPDFSRR